MKLAAIFPRFPQVGLRLQQVRSRSPWTATVALPEKRTMSRHAIMKLENRPLQLRMVRGWIWITRDGCLEDKVLGAGEVFEQRPGAPVLVQALEEAEFSIACAGAGSQNA